MDDLEIKKAIANAEAGIAENKPSYVLSSSKKLKSFNRADVAETILRKALEVFDDNQMLFRELATIIIDRDASKGLAFAEQHLTDFGNHARFQRAVALSKLKRNPEAIREIESIISSDQSFVHDRFLASKLVSLYNEDGRFDEAIQFIEPLIDDGIFSDLRMRQLLCTLLGKVRRSPSKVIELLQNDSDPRSILLKRQAADILAIGPETIHPASAGTFAPIEIGGPSPSIAFPVSTSMRPVEQATIFLVHGHDETAKQTVARFLEKFGLTVKILHELPSRGRTIIEKFEDYSDADFAVVLLTADDVGGKSSADRDLKPRARQNVILELGYFWGALGRERVCALKVEGVEVPSDFSGVLYVPFDSSEIWKLQLAKEIKAANIQIDLNLAVL